MKKNNRGFVVSAVLYPLLVLFLALIMGLLSMSDTRKRILDKMKLEISDSIFDEATCSCDTILNKLNYIIKNGVSGGGGGGGGSYQQNVLGLSVELYEDPSKLPNIGNGIGDIAVITDVEITSYYVSSLEPLSPKHGMVWIVQDKTSKYFITSDYSRIGVSYAMQYICNDEQTKCEWQIKKTYVYDEGKWILLYYVPVKDGIIDLTSSDINAEIVHTYGYTGKVQSFIAKFSGYYKIEAYGAQGGSGIYTGGKGAYTAGEIYLNTGDEIYLYVGGTTTSTAGGWNGGGNGYTRGGGGATDVRLVRNTNDDDWNEFESLKSRIMVAAGGSGDSWYTGNSASHRADGAAGGTLVGLTGPSGWDGSYSGTGGTQSTTGHSRTNNLNVLGGFGYGGNAGTTSYSSGSGGGGGWYGGAGADGISSGGGGSSYISGHAECSSIEESSLENEIIHNGNPYHYSGKYFLNTVMDAGVNAGNGKIVITLNSIAIISEDEINSLRENQNDKWYYYYSGNSKYDGRYQTFTAPKNGIYKIETYGAQGGSGIYTGGKGAYSYGNIYLSKKDTLYIYVGSQTAGSLGGWNGGGNGHTRGGGGSTDIRLVQTSATGVWNEFESLKSRIMVAAGGSGDSWYTGNSANHRANGAAGGGLVGSVGPSGWDGSYSGWGGEQSFPGYSRNSNANTLGGFGYGGNAGSTSYSSGSGGGGGYYGGGGADAISSGGGGSSYISGHDGCNSILEESTVNNIIHTGNAYHYSGIYFEETLMLADNNIGDGHARISLIEEVDKTSETLKNKMIQNINTWYYAYSGNMLNGRYQVFDVKKDGTYRFELYGAQGGSGIYSGGLGGYTYGEITLKQGSRLYVYVGDQPYNTTAGGWNGGGSGYTRGGGGATDIRTIPTSSLTSWKLDSSLRSRIMVAAGGSGDSWYTGNSANHRANGAAGGGLIGYNGPTGWSTGYSGTGGTQNSSSVALTNNSATASGFGFGGKAGTTSYSSGSGGGSGWYGGSGADAISSGGGGSSYISGHAGCIAVNSNGTSKVQTYSTLNDSISYTGYKFVETEMIDGQGYSWTTVKSSTSSGMPSKDGASIITGNSGDGYAKITYLGA